MSKPDLRPNFHPAWPMSASGLGCVKTPTFNLRVEIPSRFRKFENQKCLRPLLREDDRENNSAHSWLVHVFTQPGSKTEVAALRRDVCFAPRSGHQRTGLEQRRYSIAVSSFISPSYRHISTSAEQSHPLDSVTAPATILNDVSAFGVGRAFLDLHCLPAYDAVH